MKVAGAFAILVALVLFGVAFVLCYKDKAIAPERITRFHDHENNKSKVEIYRALVRDQESTVDYDEVSKRHNRREKLTLLKKNLRVAEDLVAADDAEEANEAKYGNFERPSFDLERVFACVGGLFLVLGITVTRS